MNEQRNRAMRGLTVLIVFTMLLTGFGGLASAGAGSGTAAEAASWVSNFDFSGGNAKTFTVGDEAGHSAAITLDRSFADMQDLVGLLNEQLAGTDIVAVYTTSDSFSLLSGVVGKSSLITVSGPNAGEFFGRTDYRGTATDAESVADTQAALTPFFNTDESIGWVLSDMTLPTTDIINGTDISWFSDTPDVISDTGHVVRQTNDTVVTLTATISKGDAVPVTNDFAITVIGTAPRNVLTDEESVANTKAGLTPFYGADETQAYVLSSVTLPLEDVITGTAIAWSTDNADVVTDTGLVTRQSATKNVTLTAVIAKNGASDTATFVLSVIGYDAEWINWEKPAINPTYASGDSESAVTQDLQLPASVNGVAISWTSANAAVVEADGTVHQPNFADGPADVVLTATLTRGDAVDTKAFDLQVLTKPETDAEAVAYDKAHLPVEYADGDSDGSVTSDVALGTAGAHGSDVAWSSGNPAVVSNTGVVHRPLGSDETVTLTVTVAKGDEESETTLTLTVKGTPYPVVGTTPPASTPSADLTHATEALLGAQAANAVVAAVQTKTNGAGDTVVSVNQTELLSRIDQGDVQTVVVLLAESKGKAVITLTPGLLTALLAKHEDARVVFQSQGVTYELPAALANEAAVMQALGLSETDAKHAELQVAIQLAPADSASRQAAGVGGTPAAPVASFSLAVVTPDRTYALNDFQGTYINRSFELTASVDPSKAVGVVLQADGSVTPVPTTFAVVGGTSVAVIKADHNSAYTVIGHTSALSDIGGSWAKGKIAVLANKLILTGYADGSFKPNGAVTRAEFAQMIARGLGLHTGSGRAAFTDVSADAWYAGVLEAMAFRGFIDGYADGSFKPNREISRQEEAVILGRVLAYLHDGTTPGEAALDAFHDRDAIAGYAKSAVASLAQLKIMNGDAAGNLNPQASATRAETAALIYNLLLHVGFLN
ncbi:S-layer homology domain-containing protein [Paenibacillus sp. MWE-103]|uniref:S-layer homology domain-containing protein n=1 Tax=Paenibacillus artemisiicola TaxID=1172618 RepID=A0ABS3W9Y0_9BACL|nr:S-layer homology domain-containing protein [Paenibacillus artemisiicola]MBO7745112.1 S-layer homology domain-containing protein [Paenibacillus artemisiicola]